MFNYEINDSWERVLDSVEPIRYETFKKEFIPERKGAFYLAYTNMVLEKMRLNPDKMLLPIKALKKIMK